MSNTILEFRNLTKIYPGVVANDNINFKLRRGEVHALVGENGAGKSTVIKTCSGAVVPSSGTIVVEGVEYRSLSPAFSKKLGIGIIYQEFNLVGEMTIWENLFLSDLIRKGRKNGPIIDKAEMRRRASEVIRDRLGLELDVNMKVKNLSVGYQQLIEIAKELVAGSKILIMDEPSAPLSEKETAILFKMIRRLRSEGVSIIYISHRLEEIFEVCDRVSVMRDGRLIVTDETNNFTKDKLISLMVGREIKNMYPRREAPANRDTILKLENVSGNGVKNVSLEIRRGEVFGLGGLVGAGRTELAQLLFGVARPESGRILYKDTEISVRNPIEAMSRHIGLVPENRKEEGVVLDMNIEDNISLPVIRRISNRIGLIRRVQRNALVSEYVKALQIKIHSTKQMAKTLSGGNQQKVVLAKVLATMPEVIILDEPTRGIDVGAKQEIYELMNRMVSQGKTIIMISSEMPELISMCDRIAVLSSGRITRVLDREEFSQETILHYASM